MLDTHINSPDQNLAFNLFVYSDANSMLGNVASPSFAMITFLEHSFLNITHSLDVYNSKFSKRPREHVEGAPPLSLFAGHFSELLEEGGSSQNVELLFKINGK